MHPYQITYDLLTLSLRREGYEVVGRLWLDGLGVLAAGHNQDGSAVTVVVVANQSHSLVVRGRTLIEVCREAQGHLLNTEVKMPTDAAAWVTKIVKQWEQDHPADRPN